MSPWAFLRLNALLVLAYFGFGKLGMALALPPGYVSALWPAAGIAFAAALVWGGGRVWPGILIGSFLTNATVAPERLFDTMAFLMAVGSTLQAAVGSWLLRRNDTGLRLESPGRVIAFSLKGVASCLIAATVGNFALWSHGVITAAQVPQSFVTWWLGDAFGVQMFAPLALLAIAPDSVWRHRRWRIGVPLLVAYSLCGLVYYFVRAAEENQLMRHFAAASDSLLTELRAVNQTHGNALSLLASGYQVRGSLPGEEFQTLAAQVQAKFPAFRAVEWAQRVDAGVPGDLAAQARRAGSSVRALGYPAGFAPATDGQAAPVFFVQPLAGNEGALGVDLLGEPERAAAVRRALDLGALTITPPLRLAQDPDGPGGMLLMAPLLTAHGQGVVVGVLDLRALTRELAALPGAVWELRAQADDANGARVLATSSPRPLPSFEGSAHLDRAGVYVQQGMSVGDRQWRVVLHMPHAALAGQSGSAAMLVLFLAFAACSIFANFAFIASGDRERIADEVAAKTYVLNEEIAERRRAEDELRQSQGFLAELVENSGALIFSKDRAGVYRLVNKRWEETTGLLRTDVIGRTDMDLFPPDIAAGFQRNDRQVMDSGQPIEAEEVLDGPDGRRYFLSIKFPLRDADGGVAGMCAITSEITELKQKEAALEQARDAAQAANVAKSQFLATMSHEIRTPMNGILGMAQLLMMDGLDETERKEYVRTILNSGQSLMTILNDILDLSKVEAGRLELQTTAFEPAALVHETAALFRESAQHKGLELRVDAPLAGLRVLGDPLRLRQMLANLVGNALKFSERGTITLSAFEAADDRLPPGRMRLAFAVRDEGIGIAPEKLDMLFQPFVQVDGSATRRFGGTGLGLSIVRRLAQMMGGEVSVESAEGAGSCFRFHVVVERLGAGSDTRATERAMTPPPTADADQPPRWVLVAEDIATNRLVVTAMLARLGIEARCAENGADALRLLMESPDDPPAAILMDCQMPVLDGYATTEAIREYERENGLPRHAIIALTADAFAEDRAHCAQVGMDGFLAKPLVFDELLAALRTAGIALP